MYEFVRGRIAERRPTHVVLDVGGVGYRLEVPPFDLRVSPRRRTRWSSWLTSTSREDQQKLFGFATEAERRLFLLLQKVSGVGTALALTLLSPRQRRRPQGRHRLRARRLSEEPEGHRPQDGPAPCHRASRQRRRPRDPQQEPRPRKLSRVRRRPGPAGSRLLPQSLGDCRPQGTGCRTQRSSRDHRPQRPQVGLRRPRIDRSLPRRVWRRSPHQGSAPLRMSPSPRWPASEWESLASDCSPGPAISHRCHDMESTFTG